jgi:ABC-type Zn2+ transport system substrate-binding protein/surface adhesin
VQGLINVVVGDSETRLDGEVRGEKDAEVGEAVEGIVPCPDAGAEVVRAENDDEEADEIAEEHEEEHEVEEDEVEEDDENEDDDKDEEEDVDAWHMHVRISGTIVPLRLLMPLIARAAIHAFPGANAVSRGR